MANYITVNDGTTKPPYSVIDPRSAAMNAVQVGANSEFAGLANSFKHVSGMSPSECWLLMFRKDLDSMKTNGALNTFVTIKWYSDYDTLTVPKMLFKKATCMSPSQSETDTGACYLVQFVDKRHLLAMSAVDGNARQYNLRCPAPPDTTGDKIYYSATLNAGTHWTWQTMLDDLWSILPSSIRGTSPTLPYTPNGVPENFRFLGIDAWDAIGYILYKIRVVLLYDPQADAFSYSQLGVTQAGYSSSLVPLQKRLVNEYWPIEATAARLPEKVRVTFATFIQNYGSDADVAQGGGLSGTNFIVKPTYIIDKTTSVSGALAGTLVTVWDDLVAVFSGNASGDPQNSTALASRATEVALNYVNDIQTSRTRARKLFTGISTTILPGSLVDVVLWHDYGDGAITEILSFSHSHADKYSDLVPYDLGRRTLEMYPNKVQLVQLTSTTAVSGMYPGKVVRFPPETATPPTVVSDEVVWVQFINDKRLDTTTYYLARLVGTIAGGGNSYPLYLVTNVGTGIAGDIDFALTGTLATTDATASSFSVTTYNNGTQPAGTTTLANMAASSNYIFSGASGHKGWATLTTYDASTGNATYKIRQMECP